MILDTRTQALKFSVDFTLKTGLMLRSGLDGEFTDSSIEKTWDGKLHVNGYVWSSLLRRALARLKSGEKMAKEIGKYDDDVDKKGVSPLWCESSFADIPGTDVRPGNRVDRKYGSVAKGALFSDEVVPPGLTITLDFNYFLADEEDKEVIKQRFLSAFKVIDEGIENIGGGWSYGFGRLEFKKARVENLTLTNLIDRGRLWKRGDPPITELPELKKADIAKPWSRRTIKARVLDGQLMAVHSAYQLFDAEDSRGDLADKFVYQRYRIDESGSETQMKPEMVIPGRSIRQALFAVPIERRLRTENKEICPNPGALCGCKVCIAYRQDPGNKGNSPVCKCLRCKWFGSTERGGLISVADAAVFKPENGGTRPETTILNRIQLCEHSMQNMNLFNSEYMTEGEFDIEMIIDDGRDAGQAKELKKYLNNLLDEMNGEVKAPPGWYRIGATSTCTGQIAVDKEKDFGWEMMGETSS